MKAQSVPSAPPAPSGAGRAASSIVQPLLRPRSVAVVGASGDVTRISGKPLHILRLHGQRPRNNGKVNLVERKYKELFKYRPLIYERGDFVLGGSWAWYLALVGVTVLASMS